MFPSRFHFVLFLCLFLLRIRATLGDPFADLLVKKRTAVRKVAVALARVWCDSPKDCNSTPCAPHACSGNSFGDNFKCTDAIKLADQPNVCKDTDDPSGVLLNFERSFIWSPPGSLSTKGDGTDIVVNEINTRHDICALKKIEEDIIDAHTESNMKEWLYAATSTGTSSVFPGIAIERPDNSITACGRNPVTRPWYIAAASGAKDIVFLLDRTSLLTDSTTLLPALNRTLEGLDTRDYFAVVAFGSETSMTVLGEPPDALPGRLQRASREVKNTIQDMLFDLPPLGGLPNVSAAFSRAFDILQEADSTDNSSKCSKLIVLLSGQDDVCLAQCVGSLDCDCVEKVRKLIDTRQSQLDGDKASIVSFTEGASNSAERLARTIVCNKGNRGIWRRVSDEDTPDTAMSTYSQIVAASLFTEDPTIFSSESYNDIAGLGQVFTLAVPVYNNEQRLVGVAGADITVKEVVEVVGNEAEADRRISRDSESSRSCGRVSNRSSCELQRLRSQPGSAICADILPRNKKCYKFGSSYYKPMTKLTEFANWGDAEKSCTSMNGSQLVKIDTKPKNKFLSGIASADGSWIGLRAEKKKPLLWQDGSDLVYKDGFGFDGQAASSALQETANTETCATIDRRGIDGNWNVESCEARRPFICELNAEAIASECEESIFDDATTSYDPVNDVNCPALSGAVGSCREEQKKEIESANPLCKEGGSSFNTRDRACCGGRADRAVKANKTELSGGDNQSGGDGDQGLALGAIIGIAVAAGLVGVLLLVGVVYGFLRYRSGRDPDAEGNELSEVIGPVIESGADLHVERDAEVGSLQPEDFESAFIRRPAEEDTSSGINASSNFSLGVRPGSGDLDDYGY